MSSNVIKRKIEAFKDAGGALCEKIDGFVGKSEDHSFLTAIVTTALTGVLLVPPAYNALVPDDQPLEKTAAVQTTGYDEAKASLERLEKLRAELVVKMASSADAMAKSEKAVDALKGEQAEMDQKIDAEKRVFFAKMYFDPGIAEQQFHDLSNQYNARANFGWSLRSATENISIHQGGLVDRDGFRSECLAKASVDATQTLAENLNKVGSCMAKETSNRDFVQFWGGAFGGGIGIVASALATAGLAAGAGAGAGASRRRRMEKQSDPARFGNH